MRNPEPVPGASGQADVGARLMLVLLCFIWGMTWPMMKIALYEIPPLSMRTATAALGALTLYLFCRFQGRSLRIARAKDWVHVIIASLLNIVAFTVFGSFAQLTAATSRVTILAYTMPIWAVLLAWPFLGERPTRTQTDALGSVRRRSRHPDLPAGRDGNSAGNLLALLTGVCWAAGTVYLKWAHIEADPMGVASWQVTIAFFATLACLLIFEGRSHFGAADAKALLATVSTGVLGNGVAYGLWFSIVRRLPAVTASLGVLGSPVIGVISSMLILGEVPTAPDIIGFALIFAASACVLLAGKTPVAATTQPHSQFGELGDARRHRALRIGERVNHGEMVGAGDLLVARLRATLRQVSTMSRLWRLNSLDSSPPTTASKMRPGLSGQNSGETLRAPAASSLKSWLTLMPTSGVRSNTPEIE